MHACSGSDGWSHIAYRKCYLLKRRGLYPLIRCRIAVERLLNHLQRFQNLPTHYENALFVHASLCLTPSYTRPLHGWHRELRAVAAVIHQPEDGNLLALGVTYI